MLNKEGIRELAYIVSIDEIKPIANYDRVEYARTNGWWVIVKKDQFKVGDKAVYIEVDSRVPEKEPFLFLEKRHYAVKTLKMCKVISQGLLMELAECGLSENTPVGSFVTKELGIVYYEPSDNVRKAPSADKYKKMAQRNGKLFSKQPFRWMMRHTWGKKILFLFFGKKKDKRNWPSWVQKTDEERCQNLPYLFPGNDEKWIATEKIDGTSTTFTMKRGLFKNDFYICSRNVVFDTPDKKCYYDFNVYTEMAAKYNIESVLTKILKENPDLEWVTIQGESFGEGVQKRDYNLRGHDFRAFNLIDSKQGRWNSILASNYLNKYSIPWVPIIDVNFKIPATCEELLNIATGVSEIDNGMREGLVFRSEDGKKSFKAVSNKYLLTYHS